MISKSKNRYIQLCDEEKSIPIFSQYSWLDAVCGESNWDAIIIENKSGEVIAALPYFIESTFGFNRLTMPKLTQKMGPWIKYPGDQKYVSKIGYEIDLLMQLINKLPKMHEVSQRWDFKYGNWLPFYWSGFKQTTYYTYRINNLDDLDIIYANFDSNLRRNIKIAIKSGIQIFESDDIELFYDINKMTFKRQGVNIPYSLEFIKTINSKIKSNRKIYMAKDSQERVHAMVFVIWDNESAYYIMGGVDPDLRNSGAMSLLLWHAIKEMSQKVKAFDFEGSMIKPIERFVRSFGAIQTPYLSVSKVNSRRLKTVYFLKDIISN